MLSVVPCPKLSEAHCLFQPLASPLCRARNMKDKAGSLQCHDVCPGLLSMRPRRSRQVIVCVIPAGFGTGSSCVSVHLQLCPAPACAPRLRGLTWPRRVGHRCSHVSGRWSSGSRDNLDMGFK